ncbi:MAG: endo-1,4-beta-xylanase [Candidatus Fibromonas sp.]|jgi:GH35 family endo-1,4-beta-xylanase|nr:endo-1,4-beta-xylanase [Candidatus Fibromonas sp.]
MNKVKFALLATAIMAVLPFSQQFAHAQTVGLKDIYASRFLFGSILNGTTVNNNNMKQIVLREFNSITPENELKPDATIVASGSTNADVKVQLNNSARAILKFCEDNNIPVRGHTLVWHSQTPGWFFRENFNASGAVVSKAVMNQRMESYIKNMFALIAKDFPKLNLYAYDVVNEASSESGGPRTAGSDAGNGQSMWVQVYGDNSFVEKAFEYARKYAPKTTKLYYNDYNEYISAKRNYIANSIVKPLYDKGLLDGMGMQSHLDVRDGNNAYPSASDYGAAITMYKNIGVEIQVTELDATVNNSNFTAQATYYKSIMNEILNKGGSAIKAVVVWGIQDDQSWRKDRNPLIFDNSGNKKSAYNELAKLIPESEWGKKSSSSVAPSSSSAVKSSSSVASSSSSSVRSSSSAAKSSSSSVRSSIVQSSSSTGGTSSSSEDSPTPIVNYPQIVVNSKAPTYYNIKGEPLGSIKPATPGVYLVKQGSSVRKIVVR